MTPADDHPDCPASKLLKIRIAAAGSAIVIGLAIMAAKFYAWHLTGSSAILSDALESIINVVAGGFALAAVITSARPPDEDHPFGHGKIEFFSAGFEGALIILAAFGIFRVGCCSVSPSCGWGRKQILWSWRRTGSIS
jgi:cation diffusion facilitator family transporter